MARLAACAPVRPEQEAAAGADERSRSVPRPGTEADGAGTSRSGRGCPLTTRRCGRAPGARLRVARADQQARDGVEQEGRAIEQRTTGRVRGPRGRPSSTAWAMASNPAVAMSPKAPRPSAPGRRRRGRRCCPGPRGASVAARSRIFAGEARARRRSGRVGRAMTGSPGLGPVATQELGQRAGSGAGGRLGQVGGGLHLPRPRWIRRVTRSADRQGLDALVVGLALEHLVDDLRPASPSRRV